MLEIYLIRHGQCEANLRNDLIGGRANHSPLTQLGVKQAELLGDRLAREGIIFDGVYSSIAVRAKNTAEIVCEKINYPLENIVYCEKFQEQTHGPSEGLKREQVWTPEKLKELKKDIYNYALPGGESLKRAGDRWYEGVEKYLLNKEGKYAVFGHGTAIRCLLVKLFNFSPETIFKIYTGNTSITEINYDNDGWGIKRLNDKAHLKES